VSCATPIDAAILADYWLAALPTDSEEAVEEHLFECDECGARLSEVMALGEAVRGLARDGSLTMVVSDSFLQRVREQGLLVREYAPPRGGRVECTVRAEDNFLIGRLAADLRGARRIDLSLCDRQGNERYRMGDIPFGAEAASVAFQQSITYAKAAAADTMVARLLAYDETGAERLLGEYTFNHTRTLPGPGISQ
jgi:hypothetical protein